MEMDKIISFKICKKSIRPTSNDGEIIRFDSGRVGMFLALISIEIFKKKRLLGRLEFL